MPDDATCLATIERIVFDPSFEVSRVDDTVLVQKLPGGPLSFLHKLFVSREDTVTSVEEVLGFRIPQSYANFFGLSNGAILFDNTFFLFGIGSAESREVSLNNIRPLSLSQQVDVQRQINPASRWTDIGNIAAATKTFIIRIDTLGITALADREGNRREYPTFLSLVAVLVEILAQHSGPQGLIDPTAEALQHELDNFIIAPRQ